MRGRSHYLSKSRPGRQVGSRMRWLTLLALRPVAGDGLLHILEIDPDGLQEVVWNLLRLPELGGRGQFDIDQALRRLRQSDPIALLEFVGRDG